MLKSPSLRLRAQAAWWLFDGPSRGAFRAATGASAEEWDRARGWAIAQAAVAIPYCATRWPAFAEACVRRLAAAVAD